MLVQIFQNSDVLFQGDHKPTTACGTSSLELAEGVTEVVSLTEIAFCTFQTKHLTRRDSLLIVTAVSEVVSLIEIVIQFM